MKYFPCLFITLFFCSPSVKAQENSKFSKEALDARLINTQGDTILFSEILSKNLGKPCYFDMWASWCKDCISGFAKVQHVFTKYRMHNHFVFLSVDKSMDQWKKAIAKYNIPGEHYLVLGEWKNPIGNFLQLDWIPRYFIVDSTGIISEWKEVEGDHTNLLQQLQK